MNPLRQLQLRQGIRQALLTGLGVVLALLLALGGYAARSLSSVSRAGTLTTREYFQQSERLENAHKLLSIAAGAVRDYLLDLNPAALPEHRKQARRAWSDAMNAVRAYKDVATPARLPLTSQLELQLTSYWQIADRSLEMTGRQRIEAGAGVLLNRLVPLRERFLTTISEIGALDRVDLNSAAADTAQFVRGAEKRLWLAIALTALLALAVAGTTVLYLLRLEGTALAQYQASIKAGIELEKLSRRLLTLQEDERRRIARELHDDFGQRMASLLFELSAAADRAAPLPDVSLAIHNAGDRLGAVAKDLQQLSRSLHSAVLDKIGLEAAIRSDCGSLRQRLPGGVNFHSLHVPKKLPEPVSLAAYRVFQEALQNVLKHSQTSQLAVSLLVENRVLVLKIKDFGRGFDSDSVNQSGSLGLVSMRERLHMVGGVLVIRSVVGEGTEVEAQLPIIDEPAAGMERGL